MFWWFFFLQGFWGIVGKILSIVRTPARFLFKEWILGGAVLMFAHVYFMYAVKMTLHNHELSIGAWFFSPENDFVRWIDTVTHFNRPKRVGIYWCDMENVHQMFFLGNFCRWIRLFNNNNWIRSHIQSSDMKPEKKVVDIRMKKWRIFPGAREERGRVEEEHKKSKRTRGEEDEKGEEDERGREKNRRNRTRGIERTGQEEECHRMVIEWQQSQRQTCDTRAVFNFHFERVNYWS